MKCLIFVAKTTGFECLKWLLSAYPHDDYTIFISDPDRDVIAKWLDDRKIPYYDVAKADPIEVTAGQAYDWLINIWGSYIFREPLLSRVKFSVNLHPSFLPYGRGRDPVVWAIRDSVSAGVTLHEITDAVDEGPIWAQVEIKHSFPITGEALYAQVEAACIRIFSDYWPLMRENELQSRPQGMPELLTRKRKDLLADRVLDMADRSVSDVVGKILAHDFSNNGYTAILKDGDRAYSVTLKLTPVEG